MMMVLRTGKGAKIGRLVIQANTLQSPISERLPQTASNVRRVALTVMVA